MSNSSIWAIDRTLSGPGQSGPGSDDSDGVLRVSQNSCIIGASPSGCLMSYPGYSLSWGSYLSTKMQSVYSTAPAYWTDAENIVQRFMRYKVIGLGFYMNIYQ